MLTLRALKLRFLAVLIFLLSTMLGLEFSCTPDEDGTAQSQSADQVVYDESFT